MDDSAVRIVLNTKGTKDKEGHEVSDEIKAMLSYMDGKTPESDYSKMLDNAVKQVKQSEERRLEYMNINVFAADERILERYCVHIELIKSGKIDDEVFLSVTKLPGNEIELMKKVIAEHPEWDDEDIAEEVLSRLD